MKQALHFVPFRIATAFLLVLAAAVFNPASAAVEIVLASAETEKTDPIITGAGSSPSELEKWKERRKRFEECGLCDEVQPFPGDLSQ